jgi:hypothetical protein
MRCGTNEVMNVSLVDIGAAGVVLVAILLPPPTRRIERVYGARATDVGAEVAKFQADLAVRPGDGDAADQLADVLARAEQSDWAVRLAATVAQQEGSPSRWRAMLAVSAAHAGRLEMRPALMWGQKAQAACQAPGADCPVHEKARLELYVTALQAGVDSGVDPRLDLRAFGDAVERAVPTIQWRPTEKGKPEKPEKKGP